MDVTVSVLIGFFGYVVVKGVSVPPAICFQQFKWQDCGMAPKAVLYYYKSGSRCEVGMWRGCLPNPNMFADEYECVQTCIFSLRARAEDFHKFQAEVPLKIEDLSDTTTDIIVSTTGTGETGTTDMTEVGGGEETASDGGAAATEGSEAPAEGEATPAEGETAPAEGETSPAGDEAAPTEGGGETSPAE